MTRVREDSPAVQRVLKEARAAQSAGKAQFSLPVGDMPLEQAARARERLQAEGHRVRLTREYLEIIFGPQRVQERGHSPG